MDIGCCEVGNFNVLRVSAAQQDELKQQQSQNHKPRFIHTVVLDNSGSMGHCTKQAFESIGVFLANMPNVEHTNLIVFADNAQLYGPFQSGYEMMRKVQLPRQSGTNITEAIESALMLIDSDNHADCHHILTFLSDGRHMAPVPLIKTFMPMQQGKKVSVIVVGIADCDVAFGMRLKTGVETVHMETFDNIYYAKNQQDFATVCANLQKSFEEFAKTGSSLAKLSLNYPFVFSHTNQPQCNAYVSPDQPQFFLVEPKGNVEVRVDGNLITTSAFMMLPRNVESVLALLMNHFAQLRLTMTSTQALEQFRQQVEHLDNFIVEAESMLEKNLASEQKASEEEEKKTGFQQRLKQLKKHLKMATGMFAEKRNQLHGLLSMTANDSASQAAFLNGASTGKFAAKALRKANTVGISVEDVFASLKTACIDLDKALGIQYPENAESSCLSCNSTFEQAQEWKEAIEKCSPQDFKDIYGLLTVFGFNGYPVSFAYNNAVQMDPYQTSCERIETVMIDSGMLYLAKQKDKPLLSPHSNEPLDNILVLVDPSCPRASALMVASPLYTYLASAILCKDLYMFNPSMQFAMHCHAFVKAMGECHKLGKQGKAYLELALKIVYSARKLPQVKSRNELRAHWLNWSGLTQLEDDGCAHPNMLPLLLATTSSAEPPCASVQIPIINCLNEMLARKIRLILSHRVHQDPKFKPFVTNVGEKMSQLAIAALQKFFGITPDNSPKANVTDPFAEEPDFETVALSCQEWEKQENHAVFDVEEFKQFFQTKQNISDWVNSQLHDEFAALRLARILFAENECKDNFEMECERQGRIPQKLLDGLFEQFMSQKGTRVEALLPNSVFISCSDETKLGPVLNMLTQAVLCHDNKARANVTQEDVCLGETTKNLIVKLRMAHYFDSLKIKKEAYAEAIEQKSFYDASKADVDTFRCLLVGHTHGLPKQVYWSYYFAAQGNEDKEKAFLAKSNASVTFRGKNKFGQPNKKK